jgi:hypothetical protein
VETLNRGISNNKL